MIQFHLNNQSVSEKFSSDTHILPVFKDSNAINQILKTHDLDDTLTSQDFDGKENQVLPIYKQKQRIILIGLGDSQKKRTMGHIGQIIAAFAKTLKIQKFFLNLNHLNDAHSPIESLITQMIIGFYIKNSEQQSCQKSSNEQKLIESVHLVLEKDVQSTLNKAQCIGKGIASATRLSNMPANQCYPDSLVQSAQSIFKNYSEVSVKILDDKALKQERMEAILAVGKGSDKPPRLAQIIYQPKAAKNKKPIVIIGKGITFDSGGLSLKPPGKMDEMKFDMSGAASVIGVLQAILELKLPIFVVGIIASAENMLGQNAYRPSDVIKTRSNQTVEVLNTDAEGRLVLCDAITYAKDHFDPQQIIDIATLTGAAIVGLGKHYSALVSNHDPLAKQLLECSNETFDYAWRLPIDEIFETLIESEIADFANINTKQPGSAGTITAACFLKKFVGETPWAHLDIAGTAWTENKQSTGRPIPLLVEYLSKLAK